MDIQHVLEHAEDAMTVGRVFGTPYERDGVAVIPVAVVRGGGGGGGAPASRSGGGFGLLARPIGAYVVREGRVSFRPAVDLDRVLALVGLLGAFGLAALALRARPRRMRLAPFG